MPFGKLLGRGRSKRSASPSPADGMAAPLGPTPPSPSARRTRSRSAKKHQQQQQQQQQQQAAASGPTPPSATTTTKTVGLKPSSPRSPRSSPPWADPHARGGGSGGVGGGGAETGAAAGAVAVAGAGAGAVAVAASGSGVGSGAGAGAGAVRGLTVDVAPPSPGIELNRRVHTKRTSALLDEVASQASPLSRVDTETVGSSVGAEDAEDAEDAAGVARSGEGPALPLSPASAASSAQGRGGLPPRHNAPASSPIFSPLSEKTRDTVSSPGTPGSPRSPGATLGGGKGSMAGGGFSSVGGSGGGVPSPSSASNSVFVSTPAVPLTADAASTQNHTTASGSTVNITNTAGAVGVRSPHSWSDTASSSAALNAKGGGGAAVSSTNALLPQLPTPISEDDPAAADAIEGLHVLSKGGDGSGLSGVVPSGLTGSNPSNSMDVDTTVTTGETTTDGGTDAASSSELDRGDAEASASASASLKESDAKDKGYGRRLLDNLIGSTDAEDTENAPSGRSTVTGSMAQSVRSWASEVSDKVRRKAGRGGGRGSSRRRERSYDEESRGAGGARYSDGTSVDYSRDYSRDDRSFDYRTAPGGEDSTFLSGNTKDSRYDASTINTDWYGGRRGGGYLNATVVSQGTYGTGITGMYTRGDYVRHLIKEEGGRVPGRQDPYDFYPVRQRFGYWSIFISAGQLFLLVVIMCLCGVAPLDVNPAVGPFPDALSEWGSKNPYLMLRGNQYWRVLTSTFLHSGVVHLLVNTAVQLETGAFFEREWGSGRWIVLYLSGAMGGSLLSCILDPDTVAATSSGSIMGLFGAKLSEILCQALFEQDTRTLAGRRPTPGTEQVGGVLCWSAIVSLLGLLPYVDFTAHLGGLISGFVVGVVVFSCNIRSPCFSITWFVLGILLCGMVFSPAVLYLLFRSEPEMDLEDACEYYRALYTEGYDCTCTMVFDF